ncbi:MAG: N-acetyltransferase [Deltaproteobacteria bacterium]|jgi:ribosomal protein S18 acetylase RimI-like enzyme|nr:N-acetyltransferase [Deltaproteobacteria bacterium]
MVKRYTLPPDYKIKTLLIRNEPQIKIIGELAEEAFIRFGHYRDFISELVWKENVITSIIVNKRDDQDIIGFLVLGFFYEDSDKIPKGLYADILAIAIDEIYRNRGLGNQLLKWCLELIENLCLAGDKVNCIKLTVAPDNQNAVALFRKFGFEFEHEEIGEYATGVEAKYMFKDLNGLLEPFGN